MRRRLAAFAAALPLALLGPALAHASTPVATNPLAPGTAQAGAALPFTELNAATSPGTQTNGVRLGPDYQYGSLAAEATGRRAVQLSGKGQYVSFRLTRAANAVDFHYAVPDALRGGGITAPLDLYVNGRHATTLQLTSQFSWLYGTYPFTNTPFTGQPDGQVPHDFYNDVRYSFGRTLPAGSVVRLQVDAGDDAPWYVVNTADFEQVAPPAPAPAGYADATKAPYDVDATGATDTTAALQAAIDAASASGQGLYLPPGTYTVSRPLDVDHVKIAGAGEWYTELTGHDVEFNGNQNPPSTGVQISGLAMFGNVDVRDDSNTADSGFNGGFSDSRISHVWIQNEKTGVWVIGPSTGLTVDHLRIQDTTADGLNLDALDGPVTDTTVTQNFVRNTGDDGLALWSENYADTGDTLSHNTVDSPSLANNVGIYGGGAGDVVSNNLLQDTVTRGGGVNIAQRFDSVPESGPLRITGNTLLRTGQWDPGYDYGVGAVWFDPEQGDLDAPVELSGNTIADSPYSAFMFQNSALPTGNAVTGSPAGGYTVRNVTISDTTVRNSGTYVFQDQAPGSATVTRTTATGTGTAGVFSCGPGFTLTRGPGDYGFNDTACRTPKPDRLWTYPSVLTFEAATVGTATPVQKVAVMNTDTAAATALAAARTSPGFTVTADPVHPCGTTLDAASPTDNGSWCLLDVSYTARANGTTRGTLTLPAAPGAPGASVQLFGSTDPIGGDGGVAPPDNLALTATMTASSALAGFPASLAADGNNGSYWESQDGDAFPQSLTADLGAAQPVGSVTLALPPNWGARTETVEIQGSVDGTDWTTLVPAADYTLAPDATGSDAGDQVTVALPADTTAQQVRLVFTGNTGWPAAQLSEFEIYG